MNLKQNIFILVFFMGIAWRWQSRNRKLEAYEKEPKEPDAQSTRYNVG